MLRIVVADDEPIEREAVRHLLARYLPDMTVVGEAGTGGQAVELVEQFQPDVVLMDIEMPGLGGLEAVREIKQRSPRVRCIIVTAYDHFHLARNALQLGVLDYLLKPVKRETMVEVLSRLAAEVADERARRQAELRRKEQWHHLQSLAERELARALVNGADAARSRPLLEVLGLQFEAGIALAVAPAAPDLSAAAREQALRQIGTVAHSLCPCAVGVWEDGPVPVVLELEPPLEEDAALLTWAAGVARRLRDRVREQTGIQVSVGVGGIAGSPGLLPASWRQASRALGGDAVPAGAPAGEDADEPTPASGQGSGPDGSPPGAPAAMAAAAERARAYIRSRYAGPVSLEQVAQEVSLTPVYLSRLFKQVTGENFIDYLTRVRIAGAQTALADPTVSIKDVAQAVGYPDPNYFSRVFHKVTGTSPTEYRAQVTGTKESR